MQEQFASGASSAYVVNIITLGWRLCNKKPDWLRKVPEEYIALIFYDFVQSWFTISLKSVTLVAVQQEANSLSLTR